jgi:hypothetical protein
MASTTSSASCGRWARRSALVILLVSSTLSMPGAWAAGGQAQGASDAVREAATRLLVQGVELLKKAKFQTALDKFDAAYALVPSPNVDYDRGLAYLGLGRNAAALAAFDNFLASAESPPPGKREKAEHYLTDLRGRVARLDLGAVPSGTEVTVDEHSYGTTPLDRTIYLDPGSHQLSARMTATGTTSVERIAAFAGHTLKITLSVGPMAIAVSSLPPPAAPPAGSPSPSPSPSSSSSSSSSSTSSFTRASETDDASRSRRPSHAKEWAMVVGGGGVALLGAGVTFGILARREGDSLTRDSNQGSVTSPFPYDPQKQANGLADQTLETIFIGAGAVALVGGVVFYLLYHRSASGVATASRPASARATWSLTATPLVGPSLAGADMGVSF